MNLLKLMILYSQMIQIYNSFEIVFLKENN